MKPRSMWCCWWQCLKDNAVYRVVKNLPVPENKSGSVIKACAEPNIYVEFELHAPGGRRPLDMGTCDRFTLSGGLITERVVYPGPGPLLGFLARHPGRWPRLLSAR